MDTPVVNESTLRGRAHTIVEVLADGYHPDVAVEAQRSLIVLLHDLLLGFEEGECGLVAVAFPQTHGLIEIGFRLTPDKALFEAAKERGGRGFSSR